MDLAIEQSLSTKPFVKGILCADNNGLLLSAKGELSQGHAGRYTAISRDAADIHPHLAHPVITIETENRKIIIKDYNGQTVALRCTNEEN